MGNRILISLISDEAHNWECDPKLGDKISEAMHGYSRASGGRIGSYGYVVQCVPSHVESLGLISEYGNFKDISVVRPAPGSDQEAVAHRLLKDAAEKLGYKLVKK